MAALAQRSWSADSNPYARGARTERTRQDRLLFARRDAGDRSARDQLIERFLPLARSLARRYEHSGEPFEDLMQVASLALVKAVDRYQPAKGNAFTSFAVPTISGELKRHFRDRTWAVRPPRQLQERALGVESAAARLNQLLDRTPTVNELAHETQSTDDQVLEALQARAGRGAISLQSLVSSDEDSQLLGDTLGTEEQNFESAEARAILSGLLDFLTPRDRLVLRLRFEEDMTQAEIGTVIGVSQMQISRILRQSISQLRHMAEHRCRRAMHGGVRNSCGDPPTHLRSLLEVPAPPRPAPDPGPGLPPDPLPPPLPAVDPGPPPPPEPAPRPI